MARRNWYRVGNVDDVIPNAGFIRHYVDYASKCTDAPALYHVASAVSIVSVAVADHVYLSLDPSTDSKVTLNLWTLVVGRSSMDRKSTAVNLAGEILSQALPERIAPVSGSVEGFFEFLSEQPTAIIIASELAALLDQMEASYWRQGRSLLMDLYDARSSYTRKLKGKEPLVINEPRICMLAASALALLDQTTRQVDWSGGFLARMFQVYDERVRFQAVRREFVQEKAALVDELVDLSRIDRTAVRMTAQARDLHARSARGLDDLAQESPLHLHGPICRLTDHVQRVAAIYALTTDSDLGHQHMKQAIALGKMGLSSVKSIGGRIARDPALRLRQRVLDLLEKHPQGLWYREILNGAPALKRQLDPILESLVAEEHIRMEAWGRKRLIVPCEPGEQDDDEDEAQPQMLSATNENGAPS